MTTPTNTQIWSEISKLRKELQEQLQIMRNEIVFNRDERKTDVQHLADTITQLKADLDIEEMLKSRAEIKRLGLGINDFLKMRTDIQEQAKSIDVLTSGIVEMKERMTTYEKTAIDNANILKEIKPAVMFIRNSVRVFKWSAILVATGLLSQAGIYLFHLIAGR